MDGGIPHSDGETKTNIFRLKQTNLKKKEKKEENAI